MKVNDLKKVNILIKVNTLKKVKAHVEASEKNLIDSLVVVFPLPNLILTDPKFGCSPISTNKPCLLV